MFLRTWTRALVAPNAITTVKKGRFYHRAIELVIIIVQKFILANCDGIILAILTHIFFCSKHIFRRLSWWCNAIRKFEQIHNNRWVGFKEIERVLKRSLYSYTQSWLMHLSVYTSTIYSNQMSNISHISRNIMPRGA